MYYALRFVGGIFLDSMEYSGLLVAHSYMLYYASPPSIRSQSRRGDSEKLVHERSHGGIMLRASVKVLTSWKAVRKTAGRRCYSRNLELMLQPSLILCFLSLKVSTTEHRAINIQTR